MVKREKSSFFGKIMGGDVAEDDTDARMEAMEDENLDETVYVQQEVVAAEPVMVQQAPMYADEEEDEEEEEVVQPARAAQAAPGEDWITDYEGQLNIDMFQTKDNVIIKSTIAGVRPDDIDVTVANDMVTIKGSRRQEDRVSQDDYFYQECYWGNFSRSVIVPVDIDSESIEADLKDGILTVIMPKAAKAKTKKVKVRGI